MIFLIVAFEMLMVFNSFENVQLHRLQIPLGHQKLLELQQNMHSNDVFIVREKCWPSVEFNTSQAE